MRQWFVGFNDYWFTSCIFLEDTPLYLLVLERLTERICYLLNKLDLELPRKKFKLKDEEDWCFTKNSDGWTDLKEQYGGVGQLWHSFVCIPVTDFVGKKTERHVIHLPYFFLQEKFPKIFDPEDLWEDDDGDKREINKTKAQKINKEFKELYVEFKKFP